MVVDIVDIIVFTALIKIFSCYKFHCQIIITEVCLLHEGALLPSRGRLKNYIY